MALFYFDLRKDGERLRDDTGAHCENLGMAYRAGREMVARMSAGPAGAGQDLAGWAVEVTYSDRSPLFTLPFQVAAEGSA